MAGTCPTCGGVGYVQEGYFVVTPLERGASLKQPINRKPPTPCPDCSSEEE